MLNWIWLGLVLAAVAIAGLTGQIPETTKAAFDACENAVMKLALPLAGIFTLWLGIMRLAEKAGLINVIAVALRPVMRWLFPDVPPTHPAMGAMVMNMAANMLGLGNAATPLGLRAMQHLERLNPRPGTATNAMCTFLAINTSSIQLIPATTVAILAAKGAADPTSIIGAAFMATLFSTAVGIFSVKTLEKLPVFALPSAPPVDREEPADSPAEERIILSPVSTFARVVLFLALAAFGTVFMLMAFFPHSFEAVANYVRGLLATNLPPFAFAPEWAGKHWLARSVETISLLAIPFVVTMFPLYAAARKIPVYEEFIEGAKEGFQTAIRIIPYLVAILVAVGMFRAAGGINLLATLFGKFLAFLHFPVELLPLVFMRPLSGSGSNAIFADLVTAHGPDALITKMGACILGSTETTFYVLAVYFGSVAIRRTRHAVAAGLLADLAGVIASIAICNFLFNR